MTIVLGRWTSSVRCSSIGRRKHTNGRMVATPVATLICPLPRVKRFNLKTCRQTAVNTTRTDDSNLGGTSVSRATRIFSWFGSSVAVNMSSAIAQFVDFSFLCSREDALQVPDYGRGPDRYINGKLRFQRHTIPVLSDFWYERAVTLLVRALVVFYSLIANAGRKVAEWNSATMAVRLIWK